jgi:hypothetical protein
MKTDHPETERKKRPYTPPALKRLNPEQERLRLEDLAKSGDRDAAELLERLVAEIRQGDPCR